MQADEAASDADRVGTVDLVPLVVLHPGSREVDVHGQPVHHDRPEGELRLGPDYLELEWSGQLADDGEVGPSTGSSQLGLGQLS